MVLETLQAKNTILYLFPSTDVRRTGLLFDSVNDHFSAARIADAISPRRHRYALTTDEQTQEQTNRQTEGYRHRVKPSICGGGLIYGLVNVVLCTGTVSSRSESCCVRSVWT